MISPLLAVELTQPVSPHCATSKPGRNPTGYDAGTTNATKPTIMGLRFRRTIKLFPGVRLNLSKSGVSTSVGVRGVHVTVGHGKTRTTVGIPGSGLSYTETTPKRSPSVMPRVAGAPRRSSLAFWIVVCMFVALVVLRMVVG